MTVIKRILTSMIAALLVLVFSISLYAVVDQWSIGGVRAEATENDLSLDAAIAQNPEVVAWLKMNGAGIDYGVAKDPDGNSKYVNTALDGSYSLAGAIFLDYRNASDFSDFNSVVYGHNMENGKMFGNLKKYADSSFFEKNTTGILELPGKRYSIETVAYIVTVASDREIICQNVTDKQAWLNAVKEKASLYREGASVNDMFLTLVTCGTGETGYSNERDVLIVRLSDGQQSNVLPNTPQNNDNPSATTTKPSSRPKTADVTDVLPFAVLFGTMAGWLVITMCIRAKRTNK